VTVGLRTTRDTVPESASVPAIGEPRLASGPSPLKVFFLVSHSADGGAQEIWANLADGFKARGHTVSLMALYPHRTIDKAALRSMPWRYVVKERPRTLPAQVSMFRALSAIFRDERPDAAFTALPAANVIAPLAAKAAGLRDVVVTSHHTPAGTYNRWLNMADGAVGGLTQVRAIVAVSDSVGASLAGKSSAYLSKRRTIRNALPPPVEHRLAELGGGRERTFARGRTIVASGRLAPQKNYPVLLRAAARMNNVLVKIIGGGPDEMALKAQAAALGVADRVRFLGPVTREEALAAMASGDVFVQPSLFEGHSLALIEAAKLGLPLVVSNVPVQIEGITANDGSVCGVSIDPHDDAALAEQVLQMLDDPKRYSSYASLSRRLARGVTYDTMIAAYEKLATPAGTRSSA
jgi:glycosyltransferase involved in cell wall biosynthesis